MEVIKRVANEVHFLLDPDKLWTRIDTIIGENFRAIKGGPFMFNETPLADASLVPFSNLNLDSKRMAFEAKVQKTDSFFEVDLSKNKAAPLIAEFIKKYNEDQLELSTEHFNAIQIKIEKKYLTIRIENIKEADTNFDNKNWLIISFNRSCNYVQIKEPAMPQKRFESIKNLMLDNLKLRVECSGKDVWAEENYSEEGYNYDWDLDIQPEFKDLITGLLDIGIRSQRRNYTG